MSGRSDYIITKLPIPLVIAKKIKKTDSWINGYETVARIVNTIRTVYVRLPGQLDRATSPNRSQPSDHKSTVD